jgi:hypothetical protein
MDRSNDTLLSRREIVRNRLRQRSDSYWELLATAAGAEESLAKTLEGLAANELALGSRGKAIAPSIVRERIEAVAAWAPHMLASVAERWNRPDQIGMDPWWTAAWEPALRHLKNLSVIEKHMVDVPELSNEVALLWNVNADESISWRETAAEFRRGTISYNGIRSRSCGKLIEPELGRADIERNPIVLLRMLRGRASVLDDEAADLVLSMLPTCEVRDPLEAAVIIETCEELVPGSSASLYEALIRLISGLNDVRKIIPMAYVLVSEDWEVP